MMTSLQRVRILTSMGRNEEAEEVLRNALSRTGNGRLHLEWARLLTAKGETDVARQHVRSAFASEDVPLQEKAEITWTYIELSELQPELQTETGQLIDLLLEAYPNDAAPFELQAAFLDIQGRPLEALEALGEALAYTHTHTHTHTHQTERERERRPPPS